MVDLKRGEMRSAASAGQLFAALPVFRVQQTDGEYFKVQGIAKIEGGNLMFQDRNENLLASWAPNCWESFTLSLEVEL